jgi:hypothetical protein
MGSGGFVASGTKQMKVVSALYDHMRLHDKPLTHLLRKSAELLRATVHPPLAGVKIDKELRLLLDAKSPSYVNRAQLLSAEGAGGVGAVVARRIGDTYITRDFATTLMREAVMSGGLVRPIKTRMLLRAQESGCEIPHLFPTHVAQWLGFLEDVFKSEFVQRMQADLMSALIDNQEMYHASIDATIRAAMRIKGQANYRDSAAAASGRLPDSFLSASCSYQDALCSVIQVS